jgi:hypothetical protein
MAGRHRILEQHDQLACPHLLVDLVQKRQFPQKMCATENVLASESDIGGPEVADERARIFLQVACRHSAAALLVAKQPGKRLRTSNVEPIQLAAYSGTGFVHMLHRNLCQHRLNSFFERLQLRIRGLQCPGQTAGRERSTGDVLYNLSASGKRHQVDAVQVRGKSQEIWTVLDRLLNTEWERSRAAFAAGRTGESDRLMFRDNNMSRPK